MLNELASYASIPSCSRGRLYEARIDKRREPHQRDRDRIIHSASFRRMQYKTQVFVNHEGDHYRTRLTHSLEVSQIGRAISRILKLNEDLTESLCLAHDLGHAPFGHAGEDALNEVMDSYGGFSHNDQTIKIVTELEKIYANFNGLNLTWETLEGIAKHNGPLIGKYSNKIQNNKIPNNIFIYSQKHDLFLDKFPSLEAQVSSLADDIAYNNHDIEDAMRAGLFTINDLREINFFNEVVNSIEKLYPNIEPQRLIYESIRKMLNIMVNDIIDQTQKNIEYYKIETIEDIQNMDKFVVAFSDEIEKYRLNIKKLLTERVYNHYKINKMTNKAKRVVKELFKIFMEDPGCLPTEWKMMVPRNNHQGKAQIICDFIAGMTDRYALKEYKSFFDLSTKGTNK